jgi:hypothetical protein
VINQLALHDPQSNQQMVLGSEANPNSLIDFNLDVGFSF